MTLSNSPHFLMCPPLFYEVSYRINPYMDPKDWDKTEDYFDANEQWYQLRRKLEHSGCYIDIAIPQQGLPDMVFTANAGFVLDKKVVISNFKNKERQREQVYWQSVFQQLKIERVVKHIYHPDMYCRFEGAGDALFDRKRNVIWMGYGQRSEYSAAKLLEIIYGIEVIPLELINSSYYHLDLAMYVDIDGTIYYNPDAFPENTKSLMRKRVGGVLEEWKNPNFGLNMIPLEEHITTELSAFHKAGGSAACLTLRLNNFTKDYKDDK